MHPELNTEAVDYIEETENRPPSLGDTIPPTGPIVFVLDSTIDLEQIGATKEAVLQVGQEHT